MINNLEGSLIAERNILGSVLINENYAPRVFSALNEEAFSHVDSRNALVFRAMKALLDDHKAIDIATLNSQLATMQLDKECNSPDFIYELAEAAIDPNNIDFYINTVRDYNALRHFFERLDDAKKDFYGGKVESIGNFLSQASNDLALIANQRAVGSFKEPDEVVEEVIKTIEKRRNLGNKRLIGIDTGYSRLNDLTHGFQPGTLNIIAARPGVGKTTFALNLMSNAAASLFGENKAIAFFSCEMDAAQLMQRLLASKSMVHLDDILLGNINQQDNNKILSACETLKKLPVFLDDTPNQQLGDIIAKCEKIASSTKGKLAAVFIDYLNIIKVPVTKGNESRTLQIALITSQLKEMARRLHLPVICLAQLNRDADKGSFVAGKGQVVSGPELSSLKESSAIEQDADTVMTLFRADWAGKNTDNVKNEEVDPNNETFKQRLVREVKERRDSKQDPNDTSVVEVSLQKNRLGKPGKFYLLFEKALQLFSTPDDRFSADVAQLDD